MFIVQLRFFTVMFILALPVVISQLGPDPWHYNSKPPSYDEDTLPPDLRMPAKKKVSTENKVGTGEWFFKRTLAILLKGGQVKREEDGTVDISLQMKYDLKKWKVLDECLKSETPLSEDMFRRAIGYVEESIYKPSFTEQIAMAWSDYVQYYLMEYKTYITWSCAILATVGGVIWLSRNMSQRHAIIGALVLFYAYEVFTSYKEAEQKELDKFLAAVDKCKWLFWRSDCELPAPDALVFVKHMNPLRIAVRMFTAALAEPFLAVGDTVTTILRGVTDGLIFPFDKIVYVFLTVIINISLIYFLIMIIFNYILNIPFHFGFFGVGISLRQRERNLFSNTSSTVTPQVPAVENTDRISQATLDKILNVFSLALTSNSDTQVSRPSRNLPIAASSSGLKRSASTGRLPNLSTFESKNDWNFNIKQRNVKIKNDGSGDAR